jgi:small-conductance mechanosensitive channel
VHENLTPLKSELEQMQQQFTEKQQQQKQLNQDLTRLEQLKQQLESDYAALQQQMQTLRVQKLTASETIFPIIEPSLSAILPQKWQNLLEFNQQLTEDERMAFQAIVSEDNAALNKIYNQKGILSQDLIQSLNQKSIAVLGDSLFFSDSTSVTPQIHKDYSSVLKEPTSIYLKDLIGLNYRQVKSDIVSTSFIHLTS